MVNDSRMKAINSLIDSWNNGVTLDRLSNITVKPEYRDWALKIYISALDHFHNKKNLIEKVSSDNTLFLEMMLQYGTHLHGLVRDYGNPNLSLDVHGNVPYFKGVEDIELWGFTNPIITRIGGAKIKKSYEDGNDRYSRDDIRGIVTLISYSLPAHRIALPTVMAKLSETGCNILHREDG